MAVLSRPMPQAGFQSSLQETIIYSDLPVKLPEGSDAHVVPESCIDFTRVKGWLSSCEDVHGDKCNKVKYTNTHEQDSEIYLIDVHDNRIVRSSLSARYCALSYVWGGVQQSLLTRDILLALTKRNGLEGLEKDAEGISRTIRDAMEIVTAVGEHYLWVDCLCIVQDDASEKSSQISKMASIYGCALLTIVAASAENAKSPICGVQSGSRAPTNVHARAGHVTVAKQEAIELFGLLPRTRHSTRAWTLQEVVLSRRCLFLLGEQAFFQCQTARQKESAPDGERGFLGPVSRVGNYPPLNVEFPGPWFVYQDLVLEYSGRRITHREDRGKAFLGISSAIEIAYGWRFAEGMPREMFAVVLLWAPKHPRHRAHRCYQEQPKDATFPSWSWLSYPESVQWLVKHDLGHRLTSLVDWDTAFESLDREIGTGTESDRVESTLVFIGYVQPIQIFSVLNDPETALKPAIGMTELSKGDPAADALPSGIYIDAASTSTANPPRTPLDEKMESAFRAGEDDKQQIYTSLLSASGAWCGVLIGVSPADIAALMCENEEPVELVLLSSSESSWATNCIVGAGRWNDGACFDTGEYEARKHATVNVMLVQRRDGWRRTRVAIGEMHRDAWTTELLETDVVRLM